MCAGLRFKPLFVELKILIVVLSYAKLREW